MLSKDEMFRIIRPNFDVFLLDDKMPTIRKIEIEEECLDSLLITNYKNIKTDIDKNTILEMFCYDSVLESIWNNPFKNIEIFKKYGYVCTPDFSIYPNMNYYEVEHNIFKNRYIGAIWQMYDIKVIPTISWCTSETYDICFKGIEKDGVVIISTIGVQKNLKIFLDGYNEMMKRISPNLIIVVGKIIKGMWGRLIIFDYKDIFRNDIKKKEENSLFNLNRLVIIKKEELSYGK